METGMETDTAANHDLSVLVRVPPATLQTELDQRALVADCWIVGLLQSLGLDRRTA